MRDQPPRSLQEGAHSKSPPPASPWAGLNPSVPLFQTSAGRAARKAGIGKSKQAAQGTNVKEALNLSLVQRQGWCPKLLPLCPTSPWHQATHRVATAFGLLFYFLENLVCPLSTTLITAFQFLE